MGENVHHKNGRRDDNRIENLELWDKSQPSGQRQGDLIEWAISIIERHGTHPALQSAMRRSLVQAVTDTVTDTDAPQKTPRPRKRQAVAAD